MADSGPTSSSNNQSEADSSIQALTEQELLDAVRLKVKQIANSRDRPVLYLLYPNEGHVGPPDAVGVYNIFRETREVENLDVILHSPGGDIHEAYDIIKILNNYTEEEVTVFIPMAAMSAATLIAIGADKIVLSELGKIGPLDPQVPHPEIQRRMPIRAVTDIPDVLEKALESESSDVDQEVKGESIIKPIAEQVDPYYLTRHMKTNELAVEYGKKVLTRKGITSKDAERCIEFLIDPPASHSYRVDLEEIQSTHSLSNPINAVDVKSIPNGYEIEDHLMKVIELFLYWELKGRYNDSPKQETKVDIVFPDDDEQQELGEIEDETTE